MKNKVINYRIMVKHLEPNYFLDDFSNEKSVYRWNNLISFPTLKLARLFIKNNPQKQQTKINKETYIEISETIK